MEKIARHNFMSTSVDEIALFYRVLQFGEYFNDMLFSDDSISASATSIQASMDGGKSWVPTHISLPEELEYFNYDWFSFHIADLEPDVDGCFDNKAQSITISPNKVDCDHLILHEMIHLHEFVLNEIPLFYRDTYFWCLYKELSKKIPDLDERIKAHGHIMNEQDLYSEGGLHDILFLMKSFDLDRKMGYELGTVMGYGYKDQWTATESQEAL